MTQKYLLAIDTEDTPGRVKATFVEATVEYIPDAEFKARKFHMLSADHPVVQAVKELFR